MIMQIIGLNWVEFGFIISKAEYLKWPVKIQIKRIIPDAMQRINYNTTKTDWN